MTAILNGILAILRVAICLNVVALIYIVGCMTGVAECEAMINKCEGK